MNKTDTLAILGVLKAAYPNFYKDMRRSEADGIVSLWSEMFKDEPVELVAMAVKAHIATDKKGFPPHIGAIKDSIVKIQQPEEMTELEAWGLVQKALRNGYYGAKDEFDKLPPVVQRLVGSPNQLREWAQMDAETISSVVASNFQRSYKVRVAKEREFLALPSAVQQTMAQITAGMKMPELPSASEVDFEENRNAQINRLIETTGKPDEYTRGYLGYREEQQKKEGLDNG